MKSVIAAMAVAAAVAAPVIAHASPSNLLQNGSFEANGGSFAGWTVAGGGTTPGTGPSIFLTDGSTPGEFGDVVAPDNAPSASPDAAGDHAAYFVDDNGRESISQTITLAKNQTYTVGFDYFATLSGAANPNLFSLTAVLGGNVIDTVTSGTAVPVGTWIDAMNTFKATTGGSYTFTFNYVSGPTPAKDVLVDRVYVVNGVASVPEPVSLALLGAGLVGLGAVRRRRAR